MAEIKQISVKYDDQDKNNKGWFASFYDENNSEIFSATAGYPVRPNAIRQAIDAAKRDAKDSDCEIGDVLINVYKPVTAGLPCMQEWW